MWGWDFLSGKLDEWTDDDSWFIQFGAFLSVLAAIAAGYRTWCRGALTRVVRAVFDPIYRALLGRQIDELQGVIQSQHQQTLARLDVQEHRLALQNLEVMTHIQALKDRTCRIEAELHPNSGHSLRDDLTRIGIAADVSARDVVQLGQRIEGVAQQSLVQSQGISDRLDHVMATISERIDALADRRN